MNAKKNILFIAEELDINGAMMSLIALLKALSLSNYNISLFLFKHDGNLMHELPININLLPERLCYKVYRLSLKEALLFSIKKFRFDLLLFRLLVSIQRLIKSNFRLWPFLSCVPGNYDVACSYTDGFVTSLMCRKVNAKKKCAWIHYPYSRWPQLDYIYDALKHVDVCVPVSHDVSLDLFNILKCKVPVHIVHNLTDLEECNIKALQPCEHERRTGIYRIVSVGRITHMKCFDVIPQTANKLKERGIDFEWYVVGTGDQFETLCSEVKSAGLDQDVHFIGARSNPLPWVKSADVVVIPSRFESWGMTVSEALCLGKAVITSDISVFKEQIQDGINGLMCEITPENLSNVIIRVLKDPNLKYQLELNSVKYPFTKEKVLMEFEGLVNMLLS